jgi:hypothetical protein
VEQRRLTGFRSRFSASTKERQAAEGFAGRLRVDRAGRTLWPSLFAYQYVAVLRPDPAFVSVHELTLRRRRARRTATACRRPEVAV